MDKFEEQLLAGSSPTSGDGAKKLMVDILHDKFRPDDMVKIKNFTKKKTGWVYADQRELRVEQPNEFTRRVWQGGQKVRVVEPGKSVIVPGWEAYVGLVRFYKQYIADSNDGNYSVRVNSPKEQEDFIKQAYLGIYDPNEVEEKPKDIKAEVENDLGLVNEKPKAK